MLILALLAVVAVAAVASASASAAVCHESEHGETVGLCIEKARITGQQVTVTGTATESFNAIYRTTNAELYCLTVNSTGVFNTSGLSLVLEKLKLSYSDCKPNLGDPDDAGCEVSPFVAEATGTFTGGVTEKMTLNGSKGGSKTLYAEVPIKIKPGGQCFIETPKLKLKGYLLCKWPHGEELLASHTLECGESYFNGGFAEVVLGQVLKLESGKLWGLMVT